MLLILPVAPGAPPGGACKPLDENLNSKPMMRQRDNPPTPNARIFALATPVPLSVNVRPALDMHAYVIATGMGEGGRRESPNPNAEAGRYYKK